MQATGDEPTAEQTFEALAKNVHDAIARAKQGVPERASAIDALIASLEALESCPAHAEVAELLLRLLDARSLEGLERPDRWTARATAAQVLVALPYPHPLSVSPEDLRHLRELEAARAHAGLQLRSRARQGGAAAATGILALGASAFADAWGVTVAVHDVAAVGLFATGLALVGFSVERFVRAARRPVLRPSNVRRLD